MTTPVVLSAAMFEQEPLLKIWQSHGYHKPESIEVGIGSLNAAKNFSKIKNKCLGRHVIFIGTCGVFADFSGVELVRPKRVHWLPAGERLGHAYTIEGLHPEKILQTSNWTSGLRGVDVVCSPTISNLPGGQIPSQPSEVVENLELYPIAEALDQAAEVAIVLAITNVIGDDAHSQWLRYKDQAAQATAEFVAQNFPKT